MFKTENQFSTTASQLPVEENYTNLDIDQYETLNEQNGYTFRYPQRWLESPSQNKAIGVRRLDIIPTTHVISLRFNVVKPESVSGTSPSPRTISFQVMAQNTLLEIMTGICNDFNSLFASYRLHYTYDDSGMLSIFCDYVGSDDTESVPANFLIFDAASTNINTKEFLRFLNQDETDITYLSNPSNTKVFRNVWNREYIEFHASFSDSKRRFIGIKGDFYEKPTVLYNAPTDGSTFNIRFTTNGKNSIYPKYCRFIIQLVFLYNYRKTVVL